MTEARSLNSTAQTSPIMNPVVHNAATMTDVPKIATAVQTKFSDSSNVYHTDPVISSLDVGKMGAFPRIARPVKNHNLPFEYVDTTVQTSPIKVKSEATETLLPPKETQTVKLVSAETNLGKNQEHKPLMAQYGEGNTRPVTPQNYLKTFNIKAPANQVNDPLTLDLRSDQGTGKAYQKF